LTKTEVRKVARSHGLVTADKPESMDLCFVSEDEDYRSYLARSGGLPEESPGELVDRDGRVLGTHGGVTNFTVGQRRGIGLPSQTRLYVLGIDPGSRRVTVGGEDELLRDRCVIERTRWIPFERIDGELRARVRVRSTHEGSAATIRDLGNGRAELRFDDPERALTPGQAAVAYDGDLVLGGGWIAAEA
jgi:tRNA-specific 2-thiouridylase